MKHRNDVQEIAFEYFSTGFGVVAMSTIALVINTGVLAGAWVGLMLACFDLARFGVRKLIGACADIRKKIAAIEIKAAKDEQWRL